jgi:hypothetical protein
MSSTDIVNGNDEVVIITSAGVSGIARYDKPTGSLTIQGKTALATLTSGVNTGRAGVGTSSTSLVKPTGAANWTADNMNGKFLRITGGAGHVGGLQLRPILANSTTAVTVAAVAGMDSTTTFEIVTLASSFDYINSGLLLGLDIFNIRTVIIEGVNFSSTHSLDVHV